MSEEIRVLLSTPGGRAQVAEHLTPVKCPDCMADLLIIHGTGDPHLNFVKHNT